MKKRTSWYSKAIVMVIVFLFIAGSFIPVSVYATQQMNSVTTTATKSATTLVPLKTFELIQERFQKETVDSADIDFIDLKKDLPPLPLEPGDTWWNLDWGYRKWIIINHTKVSATLTNFPVLISIPSDTNLSLYAQDDGDDIIITDKIGNKLDHEIELFNGTTGQLIAWVRIPILYSTFNTELYLYFGNTTAVNQENPSAVWDSNYVAVWHLNQDPGTAGTGGIIDSTSYHNNGTSEGSMTTTDKVIGKIGFGIDFDGANDVIRIDNSAGSGHILDFTNGPFTLEGWFNTRVFSTSKGTILSKRDGLSLDQYQLYIEEGSGIGRHVCFRGSGEWGYGVDTGLTLNSWYYAASVVNSTNYPEVFRDGGIKTWADKSGTRPFVFTHRDRDVSIGARWESDPTTGYQFNGILDEIRISNIPRNNSWLLTTFSNYNDTDTFYDVVDEVSPANQPPVITDENPMDASSDVSIDLASVSVLINDTEGDLFNWTVEGVYVIDASGSNEVNGTKSASLITPLPAGTEIIWYVNTTDYGSSKWNNKTYSFTTEYTWWNSNWNYRRRITIDHTKVSASLINFPVLIDITNDSLKFFAQTDGDDFVFTDKAANILNHEIELYDNTSGRLLVWVNVTTLSSEADTILFLYYGNPSCENQQHRTGTWDSNYVAVWHLNEDPGVAGTGDIKDSTSNFNNGTDWGSMTSDNHVNGKIGYGINFDGTNDVIHIDNSNIVGHSLDFTNGPFTLEAWFNTPLTSNQGTLINKRNSIGTTHYDQYQFYLQPNLFLRANGEYGSGTDTLSANTWYYAATVVNTSNWPVIYRDGVLKAWSDTTGTRPYTFIHCDVNVSIGARWENYPTTGFRFTGVIDEARISNIDRSSAWISTTYTNYESPDSFSFISDEESKSGNFPPSFSHEQPQNNAINISINQATVSVCINDTNGDLFDWTIEGSYLSNSYGTDESNGTKFANLITPLPFDTSITWYVNATDGNYTRSTYAFRTRIQYVPNPPNSFISSVASLSQIDLSWMKDISADTTYIERNNVASWNKGEGTTIYNGTNSDYQDTGLTHSTTYYYQAWSYNDTDHVYSTTYASAQATIPAPIPLTDWMYRKTITIDHTKIADDLTNFPVLIQINNDADLSVNTQDDFGDLLFTNASIDWGTGYSYQRLYHEIEEYNSSSGNATIWVNVTSLSSTTDTILFMYYGNSDCDNQQDPENVWPLSYKGVWHFSGNVLDSTGENNDGINYGSVNKSGKIGVGRYFDGDDYITSAYHCLGVTNDWTASCWFQSNSSSTMVYHYLLSTGGYSAQGAAQLYHNAGDAAYPPIDEIRSRLNDGNSAATVQIIYHNIISPKDEWHLVHLTWNASSHTMSLYLNGSLVQQTTNTNVDSDAVANALNIGRRFDGDVQRYHVGEIDEIRISNPVKTAEWISTEYNNQYDPTTFYSISSQQVLGNDPPEISAENPINTSVNVDISQASVSVYIEDPDGDLIDWSIQGLNVNNADGTDDDNGTKSASLITPLPFNTNIIWYVNASDGNYISREVYSFLTRSQFLPIAPLDFAAMAVSRTRIDLSWTKGDDADKTLIERNLVSTWNRGEGTIVYNNTGTSYSDIGLSENVQYYYQAWGWNETDDVFSITFTAADATTFANHPVVVTSESPLDDAGDVAIDTASVSVLIQDLDADVFDWTIEGQYVVSASGDDESNGTKSANLITPLPYGTDIVWYVNATDGYDWTRIIFNFTTTTGLLDSPEVILISPTNESILGYDDVFFNCSITDDTGIKNASLYTNISGTWHLMETKVPLPDEYLFDPLMELWMHFNKDPAYGETETLIYDFSGNAHNGTATNGAASSTTGRFGGSYSFDGVNDVIRLPSGNYSFTGKSGATMAAWVKPASGQTSAAGTVIFIDRAGTSTTRMLISVNSNLTVSVKARSNAETPLPTFTTTQTIPLDSWTHVVGIVNLSSDTALIYINGQLSASGTLAFIDPTFATTNSVNAGFGGIYGISGYNFKGMIDESTVFTYALSAKEVQELYLGKRPTLWNPSFIINDIPQGTYQWNCLAYDNDNLSSWAVDNWEFTIHMLFIPNPPTGLSATSINRIRIDLAWTKGVQADRTYIERNIVSSWNMNEGVIIYNDTGSSYTDNGLNENTHYYYQAWSWNQTYHTFSVTSAAADATTFANHPVVVTSESPLDDAGDVAIDTASVSVLIQDLDADVFDWTIEGQYVVSASADDESNGTKSADLITPLPYDTDIVWYVNATDGYGWTRKIYNFTTKDTPAGYPTVTLLAPTNNTLIDHSNVVFNCTVTDNTSVKNVSLFTNIGGTWHQMDTKTYLSGEYAYDPLMELWMHFNKDVAYGETDTHLYDFSGKKHNGTATGGTAYTSAGKYGGAYTFDGSDDVITLTSSNYNLGGKNGATMAAWVNPSSGQTSAAGTILFIDRAGGSATRMLISVNNDRTVSVKGRSNDEALQTCTSTQTIPYDTWSHIIGIINLSSNTMHLYINGVHARTQTMAFTQTTFFDSTATNPGLGGINGVANFNFKGLIDETTMIPRVITSLEAQALYNGSEPTSCGASYTITDIPEGTYQWNCLAYNSANNSAWAANNWTFTILSPLELQFVSPTPSNGAILNSQTATINISATRNLSSCILTLLNDGVDNDSFTITISQNMVDKWEFRYPVTYIFNLSDVPSNAQVIFRDTFSDPWKLLPKKTENEFFNGIECVRFNSSEKKAYVSVGFNSSNTIYLKFLNISLATYDSIAPYYDNRKATYSLSDDNWGKISSANPGAVWQGMTNDASDKYQASIHATRIFNIPISIAINSRMAGGASMWDRMQDELDYLDYSWEPTIHTRTHPCSIYTNGYAWEILGCRDDILENLTNIPYGQHIFEFILPCGYQDSSIESTSAGEFLFLRDWTGSDHPSSTIYEPWNTVYDYYGIGGLETKAYDPVFEARSPSGRYYATDVAVLNNAFDTVYNNGGIFYAMFHPDRYSNSVIYDTRPGVDGVNGSSLMQHLSYVANRTDVWYVANGWMYSYHYVAENAVVTGAQLDSQNIPMTIVNNDGETYAYHTLTNLQNGTLYFYYITANDTAGHFVRAPLAPGLRNFTVRQPSSWWNTAWSYRKQVIIDHAKVAGNHMNFPVLIALSSDTDLANKAQNDGGDITFTDEWGTQLSHEIEFYDSTSGQLIVWIKVPSISSIQDTILYLYYGNNACENQEDITQTWGSHYRLVQHLNETTGIHHDSSMYYNDGTYYGSTQNVSGIIDGADQFVGDLGNIPGGDYIDCGNATSLNLNTAITISSWIKPIADQINWNHLCTKGANSPNRVYQLSIEANETIDFIINGDNTNAKATTAISVPIDEWSYITGTYDGNIIKVYINGIQQASKSYTNAINTNEVHLYIAGRVDGTGNVGSPIYTFNGSMDEIRISDIANDDEWILTEYYNQNNPSEFIQVGNEEHSPQQEYTYMIPVQTYWNIVSMPFNKSQDKAQIKISYDGTEYTWDEAASSNIILDAIYNWNRTSQNYDIKDSFKPGSAYWMWSYYPCNLVITLNEEYQNGSIIDTLQQRWNIIGVPYNISLAKQDIIIKYNGTDYTWLQATTGSNPIILGFIYGWNRDSQIYQLSDQLDAGYGYWMYAYYPCLLQM
jgi:hypothetical protein